MWEQATYRSFKYVTETSHALGPETFTQKSTATIINFYNLYHQVVMYKIFNNARIQWKDLMSFLYIYSVWFLYVIV